MGKGSGGAGRAGGATGASSAETARISTLRSEDSALRKNLADAVSVQYDDTPAGRDARYMIESNTGDVLSGLPKFDRASAKTEEEAYAILEKYRKAGEHIGSLRVASLEAISEYRTKWLRTRNPLGKKAQEYKMEFESAKKRVEVYLNMQKALREMHGAAFRHWTGLRNKS